MPDVAEISTEPPPTAYFGAKAAYIVEYADSFDHCKREF